MRLEKRYKPSFHKANARYRGVTELNQYMNFVQESAHDLLLLSHITTGNEATDMKGHEQEAYENFVAIMTGDEEVGKSNLFTASSLQKIDYSRSVNVPALSNWSALNECEVTQAGDSYTLLSKGLKDPVGIYSTLYVEPGDKLYIRLKAKSSTGAVDFSFGSNNMRVAPNENGDTRKVSLKEGADYVTLDYVLRCKYAESIHLNINVHEAPDVLKETTVDIKDVEIYYFYEKDIRVSSFDEDIKPLVNDLEEQINSIR